MDRSLYALIPAGGEGTRLRPHTFSIPKPLLLMGSPYKKLIDFSLDLSGSCTQVFVTTNHLPENAREVEKYVNNNKKVTILRDLKPNGAGSLIDHSSVFTQIGPDADLIILPADLVQEGISIEELYRFHLKNNADITLLTVNPKEYGEYVYACDNFALELTPNVKNGVLSTTGIYIIKNEYLLEWIKQEVARGWGGQMKSMYHDIVRPALLKKRVAVYKSSHSVYWDDAGTIERYYLNNMQISKMNNVISKDAQISPEAKIARSIVLGSPKLDKTTNIVNSIISGIDDEIRITKVDTHSLSV